jgi:hypothetical protein
MNLPQRIFLTGVPGSSWSVISQMIELNPGFNISDRNPQREYRHRSGATHVGAYFGTNMEFPADLDSSNLDRPWADTSGCRLIKSHEWAHCLDEIKTRYPNDWIMLIYRPDMSSFAWWQRAGGDSITYPNYKAYSDPAAAFQRIMKQNRDILKFSHRHRLVWEHFDHDWVKRNFGHNVAPWNDPQDILVTLHR